MQRVVVAVRRRGDAAETDVDVPNDVGAAELVEQLAHTLGVPGGQGALELRSVSFGRALYPDETLADAGLWDGSILVLARSTDALDVSPPGGALALALANAPRALAVVPMPPPPTLALPVADQVAPRSRLPLLLLGVALLTLLGLGAAWLTRRGDTTATSATQALATPRAVDPTPTVVSAPTAPALARPSEAAPSTGLGQSTPDEETAWRNLLGGLDAVWGVDWQAAISLLQAFHTQHPTRTAATDKLYAALVEYARALRDVGQTGAAAEALDQAIRLQPQRLEAPAELASTAPQPTPTPEPSPPPAVPAPLVVPAPVVPPAVPAPLVVPAPVVPPAAPSQLPAEPTAQPQPTSTACDVLSSDNACPLAGGSRVQNTIAAPEGRHFYWFGVPVPDLRLHVEASGSACPCTLLLFSDEVDNGQTAIAAAIGDDRDAGPTVLDRFMPDPGPYLLEVVPDQSGGDPALLYTLALSLQAPPLATAQPAAAQPAADPPAAAVLVAVPPVVARSASEAGDRLRAAGLVPQVQVADRYSPGGAGSVAAQNPSAGTAVTHGTSVALDIASGNVVVPAVAGLPEQEAVTMLHNAGLDFQTRHAPRSNVQAGLAASIDPPAGAVVPAGTLINLTISQGL